MESDGRTVPGAIAVIVRQHPGYPAASGVSDPPADLCYVILGSASAVAQGNRYALASECDDRAWTRIASDVIPHGRHRVGKCLPLSRRDPAQTVLQPDGQRVPAAARRRSSGGDRHRKNAGKGRVDDHHERQRHRAGPGARRPAHRHAALSVRPSVITRGTVTGCRCVCQARLPPVLPSPRVRRTYDRVPAPGGGPSAAAQVATGPPAPR